MGLNAEIERIKLEWGAKDLRLYHQSFTNFVFPIELAAQELDSIYSSFINELKKVEFSNIPHERKFVNIRPQICLCSAPILMENNLTTKDMRYEGTVIITVGTPEIIGNAEVCMNSTVFHGNLKEDAIGDTIVFNISWTQPKPKAKPKTEFRKFLETLTKAHPHTDDICGYVYRDMSDLEKKLSSLATFATSATREDTRLLATYLKRLFNQSMIGVHAENNARLGIRATSFSMLIAMTERIMKSKETVTVEGKCRYKFATVKASTNTKETKEDRTTEEPAATDKENTKEKHRTPRPSKKRTRIDIDDMSDSEDAQEAQSDDEELGVTFTTATSSTSKKSSTRRKSSARNK